MNDRKSRLARLRKGETLPDALRRTSVIAAQITEAEKAWVRDEAEREGCTESELIRRRLLGSRRSDGITAPDAPAARVLADVSPVAAETAAADIDIDIDRTRAGIFDAL